MSFTELLDELPAFSVEQRQALIRRALELDEPPFDEAEEALVESRLAGHRRDPASSLPLDDFKARIRSGSKS